jgi:hypothetical protein
MPATSLQVLERNPLRLVEVYEAENHELGRHVALKFLPDDVGTDQAALERIMHYLAARIEFIPHSIRKVLTQLDTSTRSHYETLRIPCRGWRV